MTKKIKILFDGSCSSRGFQGTSVFLINFINALDESNLEIHIAGGDYLFLKKNIIYDFIFHKIPSNFLLRNLIYLPLISFKIKSSFLISQYVRPLFIYGNSISVIHDVLFLDFKKFFDISYIVPRYVLFFLSSRFSNYIITVSEYSRKSITRHFFIKKDNFLTIPNRLNNAFLKNNYPSKKSYDVNKKIKLIYIARVEKRKRIGWCFDLVQSLLYEGFSVEFTLITPSIEDKKNINNLLLMYSRETNRSVNVKFGCQTSKLVTLLRDSDLMIYPSYAEGFGIPLIEAGSCNLPIVCSFSSAMIELKNDLIIDYFDPDNFNDFKDKVTNVILNLHLYRSKAIKKGVLVRKKFSSIDISEFNKILLP